MLNLKEIWSSDKKFKISTGLSTEEANFIYEDFALSLREERRLKIDSKVGRPSKLNDKDIFLMLLIFIRHYPTYEFLSVVFDLDVSNIKRWTEASYKALGEVLVKKNFAHLIAPNPKMLQEKDLGNSEKHILMELNNLYVVQETK